MNVKNKTRIYPDIWNWKNYMEQVYHERKFAMLFARN